MVFKKFSAVKAIALDVDGVLTDGSIHVTEEGHQLRTFHVKDGYAMQLAVKLGMPIWIISGGKSQGVQLRMEGLGISEVHLGVKDKVAVLNELKDKYQVKLEDILYIGDDLPDYEVMQIVGFAACPKDSVEEIKQISHFMSTKDGGKGAVREILEKVLKLQGKWGVKTNIRSI